MKKEVAFRQQNSVGARGYGRRFVGKKQRKALQSMASPEKSNVNVGIWIGVCDFSKYELFSFIFSSSLW